MSHEDHIKNVIENTFKIIKKVYDNQQEKNSMIGSHIGSRILFPCKNKGNNNKETRVSEQELRFVFVEQLNKEIGEDGKNWNVYYSVETPTIEKYYFKEDPPKKDNKGQSANFDLVIHDSNYNRVALIEFKANNPDIHDYQKDFVKLSNNEEEGCLRFFIQLLENTRSDTKSSVEGKIYPSKDNKKSIDWTEKWGEHEVIVYCVSLEKEKENKVIFKYEKRSK